MQALKYIHSQGLLHRDIKPENIFVNPHTGRLKVGDFGLAKRMKTLGDAPEAWSPSLKHVHSSAALHERDVYASTNKGSKSTVSSTAQVPFPERRHSLAVPNMEKEAEPTYANGKDDTSSDGKVGGTLMYLSPEMRPQAKAFDESGKESDLKMQRALQLAKT